MRTRNFLRKVIKMEHFFTQSYINIIGVNFYAYTLRGVNFST